MTSPPTPPQQLDSQQRAAQANTLEETRPDLPPGLRSEYAAIFGYGLVLAHCEKTIRGEVFVAMEDHRRRAEAAEQLWATDAHPPLGYASSLPIVTEQDAVVLAERLEGDCAVAWRVECGLAKDRKPKLFAFQALADTAEQRARWRRRIPGSAPDAFPGIVD